MVQFTRTDEGAATSTPKLEAPSKWVLLFVVAFSLGIGLFAGGSSLLFVAVITIVAHVGGFVLYYLHLKTSGLSLGDLHLGTVFLGAMILYNLVQLAEGIPLLLRGDHLVEDIMLANASGAIFFPIAYIVSRMGTRVKPYCDNHWSLSKKQFTLLLLFGALLTGSLVIGYGYLMMVRAGGIANYFALDYAGRHLLIRGLGWIGATHAWFRIGTTMLLFALLISRKWKWPLVLLLLMLVGSYSALFLAAGDRGSVIYLFLTIVVTYTFISRRSLPLRFIVPGVVTAWIVSQVIRVARSLPIAYLLTADGWNEVFESLSASSFALGNSEFAAVWSNHLVLFPAIDAGIVHLRYGGTYLEALIQLLPLAVFPGRPPAPSEWFAMTFFPQVFESGGGFGFSLVAEAYWNLKLLGVLVVGMLIGLGLARLDRLRDQQSLGIAGFILYVNVAPTVFISMRSDFATILKQVVIVIVPVIAFKTLLVLFSVRRTRHRDRTQRLRIPS
jgi:oligosaccharide repeat unit polymerase